jgi:cell division protease FtsH
MGLLSRLLVEMDGLTEVPLRDKIQNKMRGWVGVPIIDPGVVLVMGSTNRPDVIDPAVLRPGRIDRRIEVGLPDRGSRRALFTGYLKKVKHDESINVDELVRLSNGVSQAFVASAVRKDAVRLAIFGERKAVSQLDILRSLQELAVGLPQPISELDPDQRKAIAIHEAGHAVAVALLLKDTSAIAWVSIVRRGGALGYVMPLEKDDRYIVPLERLHKGIMMSLAGHEAVKLKLKEPWTGAGSDLNHVRQMAAVLISHLDFGTLPTDPDVFKAIDPKRLNKFIKEKMKETREFLKENIVALDAVTAALLERDELTGPEAMAIIKKVRKVK